MIGTLKIWFFSFLALDPFEFFTFKNSLIEQNAIIQDP